MIARSESVRILSPSRVIRSNVKITNSNEDSSDPRIFSNRRRINNFSQGEKSTPKLHRIIGSFTLRSPVRPRDKVAGLDTRLAAKIKDTFLVSKINEKNISHMIEELYMIVFQEKETNLEPITSLERIKERIEKMAADDAYASNLEDQIKVLKETVCCLQEQNKNLNFLLDEKSIKYVELKSELETMRADFESLIQTSMGDKNNVIYDFLENIEEESRVYHPTSLPGIDKQTSTSPTPSPTTQSKTALQLPINSKLIEARLGSLEVSNSLEKKEAFQQEPHPKNSELLTVLLLEKTIEIVSLKKEIASLKLLIQDGLPSSANY